MDKNVIVAVAYFLFHYHYFALVTTVLQRPRMSKKLVVATFLLNYAVFFVCSVLEFNLIFNWALFFLVLLGETVCLCGGSWRSSLLLSLSGILCGLGVNILCRCMVAIVIDQPLSVFDNNVSSAYNLKFLPVLLGFLLGSVVFYRMAQPESAARLRALISYPEHLHFQLELTGGMFLYLCLNLMLYQSNADGVLLKLWGMKSSAFALTGFYLGMRYSLRMCQLSDYREKNRVIRRELIRSRQKEAQLRVIAYQDALTGVYNRQSARKRLDTLLEQDVRFALCFIDLDGLKRVNDEFGHTEGDRYLTTAAHEIAQACRGSDDFLARYGGDEFLLLLTNISAAEAEARVRLADQRLQQLSDSAEYPFSMSLSCGVVESDGKMTVDALLSEADDAMYHDKQNRTK